ncbi:hypothetical protein CC2G_001243 [Coprinopsis cinerea AmutBmut pab1-1]|nr:hypothetical protein CC2G_001243 [Coprinopsis cinerea AmutBmut pab1-1]
MEVDGQGGMREMQVILWSHTEIDHEVSESLLNEQPAEADNQGARETSGPEAKATRLDPTIPGDSTYSFQRDDPTPTRSFCNIGTERIGSFIVFQRLTESFGSEDVGDGPTTDLACVKFIVLVFEWKWKSRGNVGRPLSTEPS